ncbi:hypothetical protein IB252_04840 [Pseudomonas sp. PDM10]|uniref:hypothetical protein n=1 Tax=Pseudomonas sp. PDM10 TaxID=2769269 RepID=UPI00178202D7|nr:hypothetical protein [Pseudomonas sp. PDM10]MBD9599164.1 hypothetical protein [Pseudomonas sp. PDM10]
MSVRTKAATSFIVATLLSLVACSDDAGPKSHVVSTDCWLDAINGDRADSVRSSPGTISFGGWAADSTTNTVPVDMAIKLIDSSGKSSLFSASKRLSRPDVVSVTNKTGYLMSGYDFKANGASLAPGEYGISIEMYRDKSNVSCAISKKLVVK